MLIVNADDYGREPEATDLTVACFAAGQVTSTTAMVWMADSDRASSLAGRLELPVGLHLNLSEAFTDPAVPPSVRERQARLVARFGPDRGRQRLRWLYDPRIRADVEQCITDQLARFAELYGRPPTHVDGHQHVHLSPNVLFARALGPVTRMRGATRGLKRRAIGQRFDTTDRFFDIADVDPRSSTMLSLAAAEKVEVMCHPGFGHEHERLVSPEWASALRAYRTGSFADLGA